MAEERKKRRKMFKRKLLMSMVLISFLPIVAIGSVSSALSERVIQKNYIRSQKTSLNMADSAIENIRKGIVRSCRNVLANDRIMKIQEETDGYTLGNRNLLDREMQDMFFDNSDIESIFLLHNSEEIYIYSRKEKMNGIGRQFDFEELQNEEWYKRVLESQGKEVFVGYDVMNEKNRHSISCVKLLRNLELSHQNENMGLLVVNVEKATMFRSLLKDEKTKSSYLVYEKTENPVLVFENMNIPEEYSSGNVNREEFLNSFLQNREGAIFDEFVISTKMNESTRWEVINLIGKKQLFAESLQLRRSILMISAATGIVMIVIFGLLSHSLYQPLHHLEQSIIEATPELSGESLKKIKGDLAQRKYADDEFGIIERRFQEMLTKNKELNEQILQQQIEQKNSELRDLQAKINPHFLYNILDCIYWMISMEKKDEAGKMVISLSKIMRRSLNQGNGMTTLSREFSLLEDYLLLQSMRYEGRFTYKITLEKGLEEVPMLNLLLQPFIENSVLHGLEPKKKGGYVHVSAIYEKPWVLIRILDNGVGMSEEKIKHPGYGICNVKKRLALFYGESHKFKISSREQMGTSVTIGILAEELRRG